MKNFGILITSYFFGWLDNKIVENKYLSTQLHGKEIDWGRVIPYIIIHLLVFSIFFVGFSFAAFAVFIAMYVIRMFAITGFYHRYFSHKTFKTSRLLQFIFAVIGASAVQRGPIWWAAHHREHHMHSDTIHDKHSPKAHSFFWSHTGWFLTKANFLTHIKMVKELSRYPELRLIDRFDIVVPIVTCIVLYFSGEWMFTYHPEFNTNGLQLVVWGFILCNFGSVCWALLSVTKSSSKLLCLPSLQIRVKTQFAQKATQDAPRQASHGSRSPQSRLEALRPLWTRRCG